MSIVDVIERARKEPPYVAPNSQFPENPSVCTVSDPIPWDRCGIEHALNLELHPDMVALWNACGGMKLYCDDLWCPGGLVICAPVMTDILKANSTYHEIWPDMVLPGDLVFAKFLEDLEMPIVRCDKNAADYGSIIMMAEMDPRADWKTVGRSLEEFLLNYMNAHGEKYWTYHYQKRLAEKAAKQKLEGM